MNSTLGFCEGLQDLAQEARDHLRVLIPMVTWSYLVVPHVE